MPNETIRPFRAEERVVRAIMHQDSESQETPTQDHDGDGPEPRSDDSARPERCNDQPEGEDHFPGGAQVRFPQELGNLVAGQYLVDPHVDGWACAVRFVSKRSRRGA